MIMAEFEFWINKGFIPRHEITHDSNLCMKCYLPGYCQYCNTIIPIDACGNEHMTGTFTKAGCEHYYTYTIIWNNRIKTIGNIVVGSVSAIVITPRTLDPTNDGCKCSSCGNFVPMAVSNSDGKFNCYGCRSGF